MEDRRISGLAYIGSCCPWGWKWHCCDIGCQGRNVRWIGKGFGKRQLVEILEKTSSSILHSTARLGDVCSRFGYMVVGLHLALRPASNHLDLGNIQIICYPVAFYFHRDTKLRLRCSGCLAIPPFQFAAFTIPWPWYIWAFCQGPLSLDLLSVSDIFMTNVLIANLEHIHVIGVWCGVIAIPSHW